MSSLLTEDELMRWLNCERRGDLVRVLRKASIPYALGVGGCVATSQGAIDGALLKTSETERSEWDDVRVGE